MRELLLQVKRANTFLSKNAVMNVGDYPEMYSLYLSFGETSRKLNLDAPLRLKPVYLCFQVIKFNKFKKSIHNLNIYLISLESN